MANEIPPNAVVLSLRCDDGLPVQFRELGGVHSVRCEGERADLNSRVLAGIDEQQEW